MRIISTVTDFQMTGINTASDCRQWLYIINFISIYCSKYSCTYILNMCSICVYIYLNICVIICFHGIFLYYIFLFCFNKSWQSFAFLQIFTLALFFFHYFFIQIILSLCLSYLSCFIDFVLLLFFKIKLALFQYFLIYDKYI